MASKIEQALETAQNGAKRARTALATYRETVPGTVAVYGLGGAAAGAAVDRYAPAVMGFAPSVLVGAGLVLFGSTRSDPGLTSAGVGMLAPYVRGVTESAFGALGA